MQEPSCANPIGVQGKVDFLPIPPIFLSDIQNRGIGISGSGYNRQEKNKENMDKISTATLSDLVRRGPLGVYYLSKDVTIERGSGAGPGGEGGSLLLQLERGFKSLPNAPSFPVMILRDTDFKGETRLVGRCRSWRRRCLRWRSKWRSILARTCRPTMTAHAGARGRSPQDSGSGWDGGGRGRR
jgi:hypothetical protein